MRIRTLVACITLALVGIATHCVPCRASSPAGELEGGIVAMAPIAEGLPTVGNFVNGRPIIEPRVQFDTSALSASEELGIRWLQTSRPMAQPTAQLAQDQPLFAPDILPPPSLQGPSQAVGGAPLATSPLILEAPPIFENMVQSAPLVPLRIVPIVSEPGLGSERLPFSLFDIDPAQPFNNFRVRAAAGYNWQLPDRAGYFWGPTLGGGGPPRGETLLDYQDLRLRMELGSKKFSTAFEVPFRAVNPDLNRNHAGLGDMQISVKTVLINGKQLLMTQYFGVHLPTGSGAMGLGRGRVGLEPGMLFRNRWSEQTWLHGELKYWFPVGVAPNFQGQVLKFAFGANHVWYETDTSAIIPSLEITNYTVLNGLCAMLPTPYAPSMETGCFTLLPACATRWINKGIWAYSRSAVHFPCLLPTRDSPTPPSISICDGPGSCKGRSGLFLSRSNSCSVVTPRKYLACGSGFAKAKLT